MATHLSVGRINVSKLRESYRSRLKRCLECCEGTKAIVWDESLMGPFDLIAENTLLKDCEVIIMWSLRAPLPSGPAVRNIIFFVRPNISLMQTIARCILGNDTSNPFEEVSYHLFFVPRKNELCIRKLEELRALESFTNVGDFPLEMLPLDYDLLSLDYSSCFADCFINNDYKSLHYVAKSLMTLQELYGTIPNVYGKGASAGHVWDILKRMTREYNISDSGKSQIDNLLLIDRSVDVLSPLLNQLTYEGLIDEILSINNTIVRLPSGGDKGKVILNSGDKVFSDIRDKNFHSVGAYLSKQAKLLTSQSNERHEAKTVEDMKNFVMKLPHIQAVKSSLSLHTNIAHIIHQEVHSHDFIECLDVQQQFYMGSHSDKPHEIIEKYIAKRVSLNKVLRLICIQSYCSNGLKPKVFEQYKRDILLAYGFENIITLQNLERAGLIKVHTSNLKTYSTLRKTLKLTVEDVNIQNPKDISYTYSGYAPLTVRLAQFLHRPGWRSIEDVLSHIPGPTIQEVQVANNPSSFSSSQPKCTLVFFIGGVTFAEIAALRFLSQLDDAPAEYIVASTSIINGDNWMKSLCHTLTPVPRSLNPFD
ncbi:DgyrCDS13141 [Dimorphilus gyrociliatus]|uniref:DgyrCDS13141 n=1 Tax=Dimorphilus gyrociliatus TaxID=2664684 RepID=A0A7I8W9S2_9ANNE|nr:DgyrCDS13141 [Dimorphilus gyrociliatus]